MTDTPMTLRIFGSRAKGSHRPDSDIDVLIEGQNSDIERVKVALEEWSIEQGGPIDLFIVGSVDNEIDLVAAYSVNDSRVVGVGDSEDFEDLMAGAQTVDLAFIVDLCKAVDPVWGQTTQHDKVQRKAMRP